MTAARPVLAVTGLLAEARIAAGEGVLAVAGGGEAARLATLIEAALTGGVVAIISFGIAGGLAPGLAPGASVIARGVGDGREVFETDRRWTARLAAALPHAHLADLAGVDEAVRGRDGKAALRAATGAAAVDMESHVAARLAARHRVPFAALRIVADPAERGLPRAALVGLRPDGSTDAGAVLMALARRPLEVPALVRTALDARAAFAALERDRRRLGPPLGFARSPALDRSDRPATPASGVELPAESA